MLWQGVINKFRGFRELLNFDNALELILTRILFTDNHLVTYRYRGMRIVADHAGGDHCGIRSCLASNMYKPFIEFLNFNHPVNVLDLGANAGGFALLLKSQRVDMKKLVAVEMNPLTCARLNLNLIGNLSPAPTVVNKAVTGRSGKLKIRASRGSTGQSIYDAGKGEDYHVIDSITLDDLIAAHFKEETIDLCKIDIEGAEYNVLSSDACARLGQCRNLLIEFHPVEGLSPGKLTTTLKKAGFREETIVKSTVRDVHLFTK